MDINGTPDLAVPAIGDELLISDLDNSNAIRKADLASIVNLADHDVLTNFDSGKHILHSGVSVTAGAGLAGGGAIDATHTIDVDINAVTDLAAPNRADEIVISDASNSDAIRKADVASVVDLASRAVQLVIFDFTVDTATGDGKFYFHIDQRLAGMNLVDVHAEVITAGTGSLLTIQIHNLTQIVDMLTTEITIDPTPDTGSDQATTPAEINTANDGVVLNDLIRIDVDGVHTTPAKGLIVTLGFEMP